jgi:hypothetical protein
MTEDASFLLATRTLTSAPGSAIGPAHQRG